MRRRPAGISSSSWSCSASVAAEPMEASPRDLAGETSSSVASDPGDRISSSASGGWLPSSLEGLSFTGDVVVCGSLELRPARSARRRRSTSWCRVELVHSGRRYSNRQWASSFLFFSSSGEREAFSFLEILNRGFSSFWQVWVCRWICLVLTRWWSSGSLSGSGMSVRISSSASSVKSSSAFRPRTGASSSHRRA